MNFLNEFCEDCEPNPCWRHYCDDCGLKYVAHRQTVDDLMVGIREMHPMHECKNSRLAYLQAEYPEEYHKRQDRHMRQGL